MRETVFFNQDMFGPILLMSLMGHAAFLCSAGYVSLTPQFSVDQGPSSLELVLYREEKAKEAEPVDYEVMSAEASDAEETVSVEKIVRASDADTQQETVSPPRQGAIYEAVPDVERNPAPEYPPLARRRGWEGVVLLNVRVERSGRASSVTIQKSSGHTILDRSAVRSIRNWVFQPARVGNVFFASSVTIPVRFALE